MFCPQCAAPCAAEDKFCRNCAAALSGDTQSATPAVPSKVTVSNVYRGKNLQIIGNGVAILGILVGIASCTATPMNESGFGISVLLVIAGAVTYSVGRFEHWYHSE